MILACPACHTRYQVADEVLDRPVGRMVRCANCGHSWRHMVPPVLRSRPAGPALPAPDATPRPAITAPPQRRGGLRILWVVLLLLIAGAVAGAIVERDLIAALWPPAAELYELAHLKVQPIGAGLDFANVALTRNADGVIVEGEVVNKLALPRDVPHLRVALRDASQAELVSRVIPPPRDRLLPGETAHFVSAFLPASDAAVAAVVTFVAR